MLRFEDRVPLLAGFCALPDALEARGHHEGTAAAQLGSLAGDRFDAHSPFDEHAEFVLGISHPPFAGGAGPDAAIELLGPLGVLIRRPRPGNAGEYVLGRRVRGLAGLQAVEHDDLGTITHALS